MLHRRQLLIAGYGSALLGATAGLWPGGTAAQPTGDWARLGQLVAQQGEMGGRQIVSKAWLTDCASHGPQDAQVRYGTMRADMGYKNFFWHPRPGGAWLMMNGNHGQRVLVDRASQTVLVQTALSHEGPWQRELFALFEAAIATQG